ncbi:succinate dehydrogenase, hydrophobic membrane anchor protein [Novosphingobium sp. FSY-8]|uniref:Succinate dehydrogenase hydrophobic membrane anchor subunit n=1 Tax=Novosphingobium ovatum TaxID=1908523 RepID=A0ABW9X9V9_9SPHN|nr:succinate dehydrogenase, hydrophobic membrane anchor protein [Novosphingobium ovatum]NBC35321.1 succinate dehydrogenase, hydrophobic membrane anchor protein [Novosphingobium ovatum]
MGNGTSIGRVRGLGSSHNGAHHWLIQRFTAIGNLVLTVWFAVSLLLLPDFAYTTLRDWFASPVSASGMALLIISTFWHARVGLQVVIEDYLHDHGNKFAALAALNLVVFGAVAFGLFCVARLALGAA